MFKKWGKFCETEIGSPHGWMNSDHYLPEKQSIMGLFLLIFARIKQASSQLGKFFSLNKAYFNAKNFLYKRKNNPARIFCQK